VTSAAPPQRESTDPVAGVTTCPRCGHEVGGLLSVWTDACPLHGTCSECGLTFAWSELLRGQLHLDRWLFENAPRWFAVVAYPITLIAALVPWSLWRRVRMTHPIRAARCAVLASTPIALLVAAVIFGVVYTVNKGISNKIISAAPYGATVTAQTRLATFAMTLVSPGSNQIIAFDLTYPANSVPAINSGKSGALVVRTPLWGGCSPREFWRMSIANARFGMALAFPLSVAFSVVAFAALPIARRRAKVRWVHLLRAASYALATMPLVYVITRQLPANAVLTAFPCWVALVLFWQATTQSYLRMSRSLAVALSVATLAMLGTIIVFALLAMASFPTFVHEIGT
jgi:hypothetical protein